MTRTEWSSLAKHEHWPVMELYGDLKVLDLGNSLGVYAKRSYGWKFVAFNLDDPIEEVRAKVCWREF